MRVTVDDEICKGHGICWALCPEVFELNADGYSVVLLPEVPEALHAKVADAVRQCPEKAISST